jgi:hypothetical protein
LSVATIFSFEIVAGAGNSAANRDRAYDLGVPGLEKVVEIEV